MRDEFTNLLGAFRTALDFLNAPANKRLWQGQPPLRFTQKVADASAATQALADFCQMQSSVIQGAAMDKAREEKELEDAAYVLGQAVAECCRSLGNETDAAKAAFARSVWQRMRDAALLASAREVIRLAQGLLADPSSPASTAAMECGITPAHIASCLQEADDYEAVLTAPQQTLSSRKAITGLLRDRFNEVEAHFASLDVLVEQFPHSTFIAGYHAARTIRDLGHGPRASNNEPSPLPVPKA